MDRGTGKIQAGQASYKWDRPVTGATGQLQGDGPVTCEEVSYRGDGPDTGWIGQ